MKEQNKKTSKLLLDALCGIDHEMIEDADKAFREGMSAKASHSPESSKSSKSSKVSKIFKLLSPAVAACLVIAVGIVLIPDLYDTPPADTTESASNEGAAETDTKAVGGSEAAYPTEGLADPSELHGLIYGYEYEDALVSQLLARILDDRYTSYVSARVIDEALVGEKIRDVKVKAYIKDYITNTNTEEEFRNAELYHIKGVDPDRAVCLRYTDDGEHYTTDHYYTWVNVSAGGSMKEFYQGFNADGYMSLSEYVAVVNSDRGVGDDIFKLDSEARSLLKDIILSSDSFDSLEGEKLCFDSETLEKIRSEGYEYVLELRVDLPSMGVKNETLFIFDNGYVSQSFYFGNTAFMFKISEDSANAIFDAVREYGEPYSYPDDPEETIRFETTEVLE